MYLNGPDLPIDNNITRDVETEKNKFNLLSHVSLFDLSICSHKQ